MNEEYHEMILEKIHRSGLEEWACPVCGRRFLVQWPPAYKMIVLKPGDKDTRHNLSRLNARKAPRPTDPALAEEARLRPWLVWMERVNFDSLWDQDAH